MDNHQCFSSVTLVETSEDKAPMPSHRVNKAEESIKLEVVIKREAEDADALHNYTPPFSSTSPSLSDPTAVASSDPCVPACSSSLNAAWDKVVPDTNSGGTLHIKESSSPEDFYENMSTSTSEVVSPECDQHDGRIGEEESVTDQECENKFDEGETRDMPHTMGEDDRAFIHLINLVNRKLYQCEQSEIFGEVQTVKKDSKSLPNCPQPAGHKLACQEWDNTYGNNQKVCQNTNKIRQSGEKQFKCEYCDKAYAREYTLKEHRKTHTRVNPLRCQQCGKEFSYQRNLDRHIRSHFAGKSHKCDECGEAFTRMSSLERHRIIHTGEQPHVSCPVCGKVLTYQRSLISHMRIHTGEKPYKCEECGKAFTVGSTLEKHMRIHTGEKPHVCEECGKAFTVRSTLVQHRRTHTGEKPHICAECGEAFTAPSGLIQHRRIHTGEKSHTCKECGEAFSKRRELVHHRKLHTG